MHRCQNLSNYKFSAAAAKRPVSVKLTTCKVTEVYNFSCHCFQILRAKMGMENNSLTKSRFRFYHYCFCKGGVPLLSCPVSNVYYVLRSFCYVFTCTTLLLMFMEIYHHAEDIDFIMDVAMLFILLLSSGCMQLYFSLR
jgi:hypothetical protein